MPVRLLTSPPRLSSMVQTPDPCQLSDDFPAPAVSVWVKEDARGDKEVTLEQGAAAGTTGPFGEPTGPGRERAALPRSARERDIATRFATAFAGNDIDGVVALLTDDAWFTMPPITLEYQGHEAIAGFLRDINTWRGPRRYRLIPTRANGQPAFGCYLQDAQAPVFRAHGLIVLTLQGDRISAITRSSTTATWPGSGCRGCWRTSRLVIRDRRTVRLAGRALRPVRCRREERGRDLVGGGWGCGGGGGADGGVGVLGVVGAGGAPRGPGSGSISARH